MTERFVVRSSVAPMHAEARVSSPQVSQQLAGHEVSLVEEAGDWLRVRGDDDYNGWMHRGYLDSASAETDDSRRFLSLGCAARDATRRVRPLPLGAWLAGDESVLSGNAIAGPLRVASFPREAPGIVATAVERFAGTAYQWGGVSPWGADCSGLVQTVFWLHGVQLPRDAWQQAEAGQKADDEPARWLPADLLFFSDRADRRITHVGISLGGARMVHLALGRGGYAIEALDSDDPYVTALMTRFVTARRIIL